MKIGVVGDIHFCQYSSIMRKRGTKYSRRLENCIDSINWAENITSNCDLVVYLGDFFDNSSLCAEELSALNDIKWNDKQHKVLVGNHEMGLNNLNYSSAHLFNLCPSLDLISEPYAEECKDMTCTLAYLPYVSKPDKPIEDYFKHLRINPFNNIVTFSHNDIKGIQLGKFKSVEGFDIEDIKSFSELYINGHIHNGSKVKKGIINVGNLTGQNFSEDSFNYEHIILILDTATLTCDVYENPFAFNFYKIDITEESFDFTTLKDNSVISVKVNQKDLEATRQQISALKNIAECRFNVVLPTSGTSISDEDIFTVDHIQQFNNYIIETLGDNDVVKAELTEVLK